VWSGTDHGLRFSRDTCKDNVSNCICEDGSGGGHDGGKSDGCVVEKICPTAAFRTEGSKLDTDLCFHCGACVAACPHGAFVMRSGYLPVEGAEVPIALRQSCRLKAEALAVRLKYRLLNGSFTLTQKIEDITFE